jgi:hypothetical protein
MNRRLAAQRFFVVVAPAPILVLRPHPERPARDQDLVRLPVAQPRIARHPQRIAHFHPHALLHIGSTGLEDGKEAVQPFHEVGPL